MYLMNINMYPTMNYPNDFMYINQKVFDIDD